MSVQLETPILYPEEARRVAAAVTARIARGNDESYRRPVFMPDGTLVATLARPVVELPVGPPDEAGWRARGCDAGSPTR